MLCCTLPSIHFSRHFNPGLVVVHLLRELNQSRIPDRPFFVFSTFCICYHWVTYQLFSGVVGAFPVRPNHSVILTVSQVRRLCVVNDQCPEYCLSLATCARYTLIIFWCILSSLLKKVMEDCLVPVPVLAPDVKVCLSNQSLVVAYEIS